MKRTAQSDAPSDAGVVSNRASALRDASTLDIEPSLALAQQPVFERMPLPQLARLCRTDRRFANWCRQNRDLIMKRVLQHSLRCAIDTRLPMEWRQMCAGRQVISAGSEYGLAIGKDGRVFAFGNGRPGSRQMVDIIMSKPIPDDRWAVSVSASETFALVLLENGTVLGWGNDDHWQITMAMAALPAGRRFVSISAGEDYALGLLDNGTVAGWGNDGILTNDSRIFSASQRDDNAVKIKTLKAQGGNRFLPEGRRFVQVVASSYISAGLLDDGTILTWGLLDENKNPTYEVDEFGPGVPIVLMSNVGISALEWTKGEFLLVYSNGFVDNNYYFYDIDDEVLTGLGSFGPSEQFLLHPDDQKRQAVAVSASKIYLVLMDDGTSIIGFKSYANNGDLRVITLKVSPTLGRRFVAICACGEDAYFVQDDGQLLKREHNSGQLVSLPQRLVAVHN